jgi:hypothetical protein
MQTGTLQLEARFYTWKAEDRLTHAIRLAVEVLHPTGNEASSWLSSFPFHSCVVVLIAFWVSLAVLASTVHHATIQP